MRILFLFLDGIGLGVDDPSINPFAAADMPALQRLLGGKRLLAKYAPTIEKRASLYKLDAKLGTPGLPQSATGQATLLTGINIPAALGYHYGPKPNPDVADYITRENLFSRVLDDGKKAAFLNAYPPSYFQGINSGRRLYAAIPLAANSAGMNLRTKEDLRSEQAISADITAEGWRSHLGLLETPVISAYQAGDRLADLASAYDLSFFEYWLSDFAGHKQSMGDSMELLTIFDELIDGLTAAWDDKSGLILLTSDHGNMEDLSTRRHTDNPVPVLLVGAPHIRETFAKQLNDLSDVTPAILRLLGL
jgi:2,3-bisphosphoglycerate-independent phosphoglycerate mutase